jgi:hypothetical protein
VVRLDPLETQFHEKLVEFLVPLLRTLLQTIEWFPEMTDNTLLPLWNETLWLSHVNFLIKVTIKKGRGDIHVINVHVFNGRNGKNGTEGGKFGNRGKGFCVVKVGLLGEPLSNKTSLVPLNRAICILLDFEDPMRTNCFPTLWKWDKVLKLCPCITCFVSCLLLLPVYACCDGGRYGLTLATSRLKPIHSSSTLGYL